MKHLQTFENFKPIKVNNAKPFKIKKDIDKSRNFLQRGIKSLKKRLDDPKTMDMPKHSKLNNDLNTKMKKLKDLNFKKLKQQEFLRNNPDKNIN